MLPEKADELNSSKVPTTMEPVFVTEREGLADGRRGNKKAMSSERNH